MKCGAPIQLPHFSMHKPISSLPFESSVLPPLPLPDAMSAVGEVALPVAVKPGWDRRGLLIGFDDILFLARSEPDRRSASPVGVVVAHDWMISMPLSTMDALGDANEEASCLGLDLWPVIAESLDDGKNTLKCGTPSTSV